MIKIAKTAGKTTIKTKSNILRSRTIILSLGGSIIFPKEIDIEFLKKFRATILELISKGYSFVIICGGGKICRKYQAAAKELNPKASSEELDMLGIETTKMNAKFVRTIFGKHACPEIITNPTKKIPVAALKNYKIILGAGWKPGCSTDKDAVLIAKTLGIKTIINMSDIEYVYDKDPDKFSDARKIEKLSWPEFKKIFGEEWRPGAKYPFDPVAGTLAAREKMEVLVLNGVDIENLKNCIEGKEFRGTQIK